VSLYKVRGIFDFFVLWSKGDREWFARRPKPFNIAGFSTSCWQVALSDGYFPAFERFFVSLCEVFRAAWGSMHLESAYGGKSPNGYGICLPRLHWTTFLGSAYTNALRKRLMIPCDAFTVSRCASGTLVRLHCEPEEAVERSALEIRATEHLGAEYLWNLADHWRKPRFSYRMPKMDWTSIMTTS